MTEDDKNVCPSVYVCMNVYTLTTLYVRGLATAVSVTVSMCVCVCVIELESVGIFASE